MPRSCRCTRHAHPSRFDGPPRVVGLGYQLHDGIVGPRDMFDYPSFDGARSTASQAMDYLRRHGPFEPHRLPLEDPEYTTMKDLEERLADRWHLLKDLKERLADRWHPLAAEPKLPRQPTPSEPNGERACGGSPRRIMRTPLMNGGYPGAGAAREVCHAHPRTACDDPS